MSVKFRLVVVPLLARQIMTNDTSIIDLSLGSEFGSWITDSFHE
jgi:hypothetical protein